MMDGNYMGDFFGFLRFLKNPTVQFRNPAVQTYRRLRRIFWPEQYFRENLPGKVIAGAWSGPWRLMTQNYENHVMFAFDNNFCQHFLNENPATRMLQINITCNTV